MDGWVERSPVRLPDRTWWAEGKEGMGWRCAHRSDALEVDGGKMAVRVDLGTAISRLTAGS